MLNSTFVFRLSKKCDRDSKAKNCLILCATQSLAISVSRLMNLDCNIRQESCSKEKITKNI